MCVTRVGHTNAPDVVTSGAGVTTTVTIPWIAAMAGVVEPVCWFVGSPLGASPEEDVPIGHLRPGRVPSTCRSTVVYMVVESTTNIPGKGYVPYIMLSEGVNGCSVHMAENGGEKGVVETELCREMPSTLAYAVSCS